MKTALVHDWFVSSGGAEKVFAQFLKVFRPETADVFTLMNFFPEDQAQDYFGKYAVHTSFMQHVPMAKQYYRNLAFLFPKAVESLDLKSYDLIISSSHSVAKGVVRSGKQMHICYCHTPMRYAWEMNEDYFREYGISRGVMNNVSQKLLDTLREWDLKTASSVDYFIANSANIASRIKKYYDRDSEILYPPVNTSFFTPGNTREDYYITASRMVPYKKIRLIAEAVSQLKGRQLIIMGDGPEYTKLSKEYPNCTFIKNPPADVFREYLRRARAFIFAANEDFGITPVEAQACGTPVIAYGKGGALETVTPGISGLFFPHQTVKSVCDAILQFESVESSFNPENVRNSVLKFSEEIFVNRFREIINRVTSNEIL
jgi:glycosyltransferase involved in cell wall biosynthesis